MNSSRGVKILCGQAWRLNQQYGQRSSLGHCPCHRTLAACREIPLSFVYDNFAARAGPPSRPPNLPRSCAACCTAFLLNLLLGPLCIANICAGVFLAICVEFKSEGNNYEILRYIVSKAIAIACAWVCAGIIIVRNDVAVFQEI